MCAHFSNSILLDFSLPTETDEWAGQVIAFRVEPSRNTADRANKLICMQAIGNKIYRHFNYQS